MESKELAQRISQLALDKKGNDIIILDLKKLSDVTDYFVIVSCESDIHVKTIANFIEDELKKEKIRVWHKEGYSKLNWVLLDYIDVVTHIFRPETREYYGLEKLWADAKITRVEDHATPRVVPQRTN
jgi:ribosome-associated protein